MEGLREEHRLVRLRAPLRLRRRRLLVLLQRMQQRPLHDGRGHLLDVFLYRRRLLLWRRLLLLLLQLLWRHRLLWRRLLLLLLLVLQLSKLLLQGRHLLLHIRLRLHRGLLLGDVQVHQISHGGLLDCCCLLELLRRCRCRYRLCRCHGRRLACRLPGLCRPGAAAAGAAWRRRLLKRLPGPSIRRSIRRLLLLLRRGLRWELLLLLERVSIPQLLVDRIELLLGRCSCVLQIMEMPLDLRLLL